MRSDGRVSDDVLDSGEQRTRLTGVVRLCYAVLAGFLCLTLWASQASADQLRGANVSPNWDGGGPATVDADNLEAELEAIESIGGNVARVTLKPQSLQPVNGSQFDQGYIGRLDRFMADARERNIKVIVAVWGTPCWNGPLAVECLLGPSGAINSPPANPARYGDVVEFALERWPQDIAAVEVWNEPNLSLFWLGTDAQYVELVRQAKLARGRAQSSVPIVGGAISSSDTAYLNRLYDAGLANHADDISIHPYNFGGNGQGFGDPASSGAPTQNNFALGITAMREVMELRNHGDGDLWLTEFGYAVCPAYPYCVTEAQQAECNARSFQIAADRSYIAGATVFSARDLTSQNEVIFDARFGLARFDFTERPGMQRLRDLFPLLAAGSAPPLPPSPCI